MAACAGTEIDGMSRVKKKLRHGNGGATTSQRIHSRNIGKVQRAKEHPSSKRGKEGRFM